mmetsp:Transcript_25981/g.73703  ORF Transcript_25981/g.73703 Transcript_25981/m.73703 type:complete len:198 (-) Transcript_25981:874-1467(-)
MEELALTIQGDALAAKQAWDEISASAAPVLAALCNGLIEASFTSEPSNWGVLRGNHVVQEAVLAKLQLDRQQLLDQLNSAVDKLSFWYDELKTLLFQVRQHCDAVAGLAKPEKLVARTCSVFDFEEIVDELVAQVGQDLACKRDMIADLQEISDDVDERFDATTRDSLLLYLSTWTERPTINPSRWLDVENVLVGEA